MHRTEGYGVGVVGGLPSQHINQSLPATGGSTVSAELMNALQEELINVIEYAGLTIEASGLADRTNGFHQLLDAIFLSDALTIPLNSLRAGTFSQQVDVSPTEYYKMVQALISSNSIMQFQHVTATTNNYAAISKLGISLQYWLDSGGGSVLRRQVSLTKDGIIFAWWGSDGIKDYETELSEQMLVAKHYSAVGVLDRSATLSWAGLSFLDAGYNFRFRVVDLAGITFAPFGDQYLSSSIDTGIDKDLTIFQAEFAYNVGTDRVLNSPDEITFTPGADNWEVAITMPYDPSGSGSSYACTVWHASV